MKMLNLAEIQNEAEKERGIRFAIAVFLILTWAIVFLIPQEFIYAQSISILPGMKSSSGITENSSPVNSRKDVSRKLNLERTLASSNTNMVVAEKRERDLLQKSSADVRSQILPSSVSAMPEAVVPDSVLIPRKLDVLSRALINQNIKGLAALKLDEYMGAYLAAIGVDLFSWVENHNKEKYFSEIFKIKGPWVVMLIAVSPTSMHEYVGDLDLPSTVGDILEANQLPSNLIIERKGKDVVVAIQGAEDLWIIFLINEKNEVTATVKN